MNRSPFDIHLPNYREQSDTTVERARSNKREHMVDVVNPRSNEIINRAESLSNYLSNNGSITSLIDITKNPPVTDVEIYKDIVEKIPAVNDKIKLFCRSTSQTTRRLVTPIMMNASNSPYKTLKQILAQIEDLKSKIHGFLDSESLATEELKDGISSALSTIPHPSLESTVLRYTKRQMKLFRQFPYLESTLRELHSLIESYYEVMRNKNIPEDWDEIDVEKAEIAGNLGLAVRNGIKDYMQVGRLSASTMELFEAHGVSPFEAAHEISSFFKASTEIPYSYDQYNDFIDKTVIKYKEHYKKALVRLGLDANYIEKAASKCNNSEN